MWKEIDGMLRRAALRTAENVAEFLPGVVGMLVILIAAVVVAMIARSLLLRALRGLHFDQRAEHLGFGTLADWPTVGGPSLLVARVGMWMILLAGLLAGLSALDAALPDAFARTIFAYLPNVIAALLILVLGVVVSRFVARSALIAAVNQGFPFASLLSGGVRWLVLLVAWAMAFEHLGIGRGILTLAFGILFGGIVLALALAVGLGSKELVGRSLERHMREPEERPDKLTHV
jgi:Conserved TM helix